MSKRLEKVKRGVALLRAIDPEFRVFGSEGHGYTLAAPLTEKQLAALEKKLGVELPDEVRTFLLEVGASGAGPHYGLLPLASAKKRADKKVGQLLLVADQGCGMSSYLVVSGKRAGEIVADRTEDGTGQLVKEAANIFTWYEKWIDRAIREWAEMLPLLPFQPPSSKEESEAAAMALEKMSALKKKLVDTWKALGHLHLFAGRFEEAEAAFVAATKAPDDPRLSKTPKDERTAWLHIGRARIHYTRGDHAKAIDEARAGLALEGAYAVTYDHLRRMLARALRAAGRKDEALAALDDCAANEYFSFDFHHELAYELLERGDVSRAAAALERASKFTNISSDSTKAQRVAGAFDPVIAKLQADGRKADAAKLAKHAAKL